MPNDRTHHAEQNHCGECGRATSVGKAGAGPPMSLNWVIRPDQMLRLIIMLLLVLATGCGQQPVESRRIAINTVQRVESRRVMHDGEPWIEVTIIQQVDPKAPAYVVGLRESTNFAGSLFEQTISPGRVVSKFRVRPIVPTNVVVLHRGDFEWYPPVQGFAPVEIALKPVEQPDGSDR